MSTPTQEQGTTSARQRHHDPTIPGQPRPQGQPDNQGPASPSVAAGALRKTSASIGKLMLLTLAGLIVMCGGTVVVTAVLSR